MKVALASDIHLEFGQLEIENTENADVLILSGDICVAKYLNYHADVNNLCEFHKSTRCKDGYRERCKECRKVDTTLYYQNNANKIKEKINEYRKNNPEKVKEGLKQYWEKNSEELKKNKRIWSKSLNGKKSKQKYYLNNSEKVKKNVSEYNKKNPDISKNRRKTKKWKDYMKVYIKEHRFKNPHIYLWRITLRNALKRMGTNKEGKTSELLGYSASQLKEHIEKQRDPKIIKENFFNFLDI